MFEMTVTPLVMAMKGSGEGATYLPVVGSNTAFGGNPCSESWSIRTWKGWVHG